LAISKILRQLTAAFLIAFMASPAWTQPQVAGQVAGTILASQSATTHETPLRPGSTVFSGQSVAVGQPGRAQIALPGGGRIEILADSTVLLARNSTGVDFTLQRGAVSFMGAPAGAIETIWGDATIRPADPAAVGLIHLESPDAITLAAIKGRLTIRTAHDGRSVDLPEGSAARITLADAPGSNPPGANAPQDQGGAAPAGRAAPPIPKIAIIAFLLGAAFLAAFLWIASHEPTETSQQLAGEISPYTLQ
jgi:hypothetical protein